MTGRCRSRAVNPSLLACKAPQSRGVELISTIAIHFLVGMGVGAAFTVRTLLTLVAFTLTESLALTVARGFYEAVFWTIGSLIAVQFGYLGGIYLRSLLEHSGFVEHSGFAGRTRSHADVPK